MATTTPPPDTYALTDDQLEFRDAIRKMVVERVAPRAAEIDAKAEYPWDLRKLFGRHRPLLHRPFGDGRESGIRVASDKRTPPRPSSVRLQSAPESNEDKGGS